MCSVVKQHEDTLPSAVLSCMLYYQVGKYLSSKSHSCSLERQESATFYSPLESGCAFVFLAAVNHLQSPKYIAGPLLDSEQLNDFESSPKRMPALYIYERCQCYIYKREILASISVLLQ